MHSDSEDSIKEEDKDDEQEMQTKRSRRSIPEKWTRVISLRTDNLESIKTYEIGSEMLLDKSLEVSTSIRGRPPAWTPLFWPKTIKKEHMEFKTADHELTVDQLQNYGEILTKVKLK